MNEYEQLRRQYRPEKIRLLLIAESPPPTADRLGSRHFYRSQTVRRDDRLFVNTVKALYPELANVDEADIEPEKEKWLRRLRADGVYMIEALEESQEHSVTKPQRQAKIKTGMLQLIQRVSESSDENTKIVLIKSNVFITAAEPLREAGFTVLNTGLVDYPGFYNQVAYREKLAGLLKANGW